MSEVNKSNTASNNNLNNFLLFLEKNKIKLPLESDKDDILKNIGN